MSAALKQNPDVKFRLVVVKGPHAGQVFVFNKDTITIGRGPENDIMLVNDPQVSRVHAQVSVVGGEVEVSNLSQKNAVVVDGASVQRWKLVNNSLFNVGETEIQVEYDLGLQVVSVQPPVQPVAPQAPAAATATPSVAKPEAPKPILSPLQPKEESKKKVSSGKKQSSSKGDKLGSPAVRNQAIQNSPLGAPAMQNGPMPTAQFQQQMYYPDPNLSGNADINANYQLAENDSLMASSGFKYVLLLIIAGIFAYSYFSAPNKKTQAKKIASTLKYEDEVNIKLSSRKEKDLEEEREYKLKVKNSPQSFRVNENFIRGMRDFQLGNYQRAREHFQLVLNLEPDHALAKRHYYLAGVRFDEIVQEKLMLGESYFKKHNFRMCTSMYTQVVNMLEGKSNDQKLLLAEKKVKECELASQGIR